MTSRIVIRGTSYISVIDVAICYGVDRAWVERTASLGLLGEVEAVRDVPHVATTMLERVAIIRRLQVQQGIEKTIEALLAMTG